MADHLDTSALVKLVVAEPESAALGDWLLVAERVAISSDLARTKLFRAVRRSVPDRAVEARAVLDSVTLLELDTSIYEAAGRLAPAGMRSLDAIHLAAALPLGDDLDCLVTYDDRLAEAARANGVRVAAPAPVN